MKQLITALIISCSLTGLSQQTFYTKGYSDTEGNVKASLETTMTFTHDYALLHYESVEVNLMLNVIDSEVIEETTLKLLCMDSEGSYLYVSINPSTSSIYLNYPNEDFTEMTLTQLYKITFIKDNK
jgi:hypothetical protein